MFDAEANRDCGRRRKKRAQNSHASFDWQRIARNACFSKKRSSRPKLSGKKSRFDGFYRRAEDKHTWHGMLAVRQSSESRTRTLSNVNISRRIRGRFWWMLFFVLELNSIRPKWRLSSWVVFRPSQVVGSSVVVPGASNLYGWLVERTRTLSQPAAAVGGCSFVCQNKIRRGRRLKKASRR